MKNYIKYILIRLRESARIGFNLVVRPRIRGNVAIRFKSSRGVVINRYTNIDRHTSIADFTYIGRGCSITKAIIGEFCSIANNVTIGQGEHDLNQQSTSLQFQTKNNSFEFLTKDPCIIGKHVWIGAGATILRGCNVGDYSIIAAGAVVTKDVEPNTIVGGVPAKLIRKRNE
jgi:virginiamycin A acetyltransferase